MADHDVRLRLVPPPEGFGIEQVWADPRSVDPHPDNPKVHPPEQTELNAESLDENGWLKPLIYNRRTGRLVDGHDRLGIAIRRGDDAVPLWVGDWDEQQEARVILLLNETGRGASYNSSLALTIAARAGEARGRIQEMLDRVREREGGPRLAISPTADDRTSARSAPEKSEKAVEPQDPRAADLAKEERMFRASQTRLVQLILGRSQLDEWQEWVEVLKDAYGLHDDTETVLRAVRFAFYRALGGEVE